MPAVAKSQRRALVLIGVAVLSVPLLLAGAAFAAIQIYLHTDNAADLDPAVAVNIRIHNDMDVEIDRLWLGRGIDPASSSNPTFRTRYSDIAAGADSGYQPVEHYAPNYEGAEVVVGSDTFPVDPRALAPLVADLRPGGYYTFVFDQQNGLIVVTEVTADPAPA